MRWMLTSSKEKPKIAPNQATINPKRWHENYKDLPVDSALELPVSKRTQKLTTEWEKPRRRTCPHQKPKSTWCRRCSKSFDHNTGGWIIFHFDSGGHDKGRILFFFATCNVKKLEECEKLHCVMGLFQPHRLISHFKDSQKDAKLKFEEINTGEDICTRKRKIEDLHRRIH